MPSTLAESSTVKCAGTTISSAPIPSDALREHAERGMVDPCSASLAKHRRRRVNDVLRSAGVLGDFRGVRAAC
jgi:hypothetical protein